MSKENRERKAKEFNTAQAKAEVKEMKARRETVHERGEAVLRVTGKIDKLVNIFGKQRVSHNSTVPRPDGTQDLPLGAALAWLNIFDSTASMQENVQICFDELAAVFDMTGWLRQKYHLQMANALVQDVRDITPVTQFTEFEGDNRIADELRLLVPGGEDHMGDGKDPIEDYLHAEFYTAAAIKTDIFGLYGLRGYKFTIGDMFGRSYLEKDSAMTHLGHWLPGNADRLSPEEIAALNAPAWWQFYFQVATGNRAPERNGATNWWEQMYAPVGGKVVLVPRATLLNETQVGAVYLYENAGVEKKQFVDFLREAASLTNEALTERDATLIWNALDAAGVDIGAQTRMPNYAHMPKPGSVMNDYRDAWPIGHPKFAENVKGTDDVRPASSPSTRRKMNWKRWGN